MRKLVLAILLALSSLPALARQPVTAAELEARIQKEHKKSDGSLASMLEKLELTERLTAARRAALEALVPGDKSQTAFTALADLAEFRGLPPGDALADPPPAPADEKSMLGRASAFAEETVRILPHFYASRALIRLQSDEPPRAFPAPIPNGQATTRSEAQNRPIAPSPNGTVAEGAGQAHAPATQAAAQAPHPIHLVIDLDATSAQSAFIQTAEAPLRPLQRNELSPNQTAPNPAATNQAPTSQAVTSQAADPPPGMRDSPRTRESAPAEIEQMVRAQSKPRYVIDLDAGRSQTITYPRPAESKPDSPGAVELVTDSAPATSSVPASAPNGTPPAAPAQPQGGSKGIVGLASEPATPLTGDLTAAPPPPDRPFRVVDRANQTILYRDQKEIVEDTRDPAAKKAAQKGLDDWGEFGPFLRLVLSDVLKRGVQWSHWERGGSGPLAVFRFNVARENSHYTVRYCCVSLGGNFLMRQVVDVPPYAGEIAIDPATGAVLRIVIHTRPREMPIEWTAVAIDYAPVTLGGQSYICPRRAITLSAARPPVLPGTVNIVNAAQYYGKPMHIERGHEVSINHVVFNNFHLFTSDMRIVPGSMTPEDP